MSKRKCVGTKTRHQLKRKCTQSFDFCSTLYSDVHTLIMQYCTTPEIINVSQINHAGNDMIHTNKLVWKERHVIITKSHVPDMVIFNHLTSLSLGFKALLYFESCVNEITLPLLKSVEFDMFPSHTFLERLYTYSPMICEFSINQKQLTHKQTLDKRISQINLRQLETILSFSNLESLTFHLERFTGINNYADIRNGFNINNTKRLEKLTKLTFIIFNDEDGNSTLSAILRIVLLVCESSPIIEAIFSHYILIYDSINNRPILFTQLQTLRFFTSKYAIYDTSDIFDKVLHVPQTLTDIMIHNVSMRNMPMFSINPPTLYRVPTRVLALNLHYFCRLTKKGNTARCNISYSRWKSFNLIGTTIHDYKRVVLHNLNICLRKNMEVSEMDSRFFVIDLDDCYLLFDDEWTENEKLLLSDILVYKR